MATAAGARAAHAYGTFGLLRGAPLLGMRAAGGGRLFVPSSCDEQSHFGSTAAEVGALYEQITGEELEFEG